MCDSFPRTETLVIDSMELYSEAKDNKRIPASEAVKIALNRIVIQLTEKLDTAIAKPAVLGESERCEARRLIDKTFGM